jgi:hypothetical protein
MTIRVYAVVIHWSESDPEVRLTTSLVQAKKWFHEFLDEEMKANDCGADSFSGSFDHEYMELDHVTGDISIRMYLTNLSLDVSGEV